MPAFAAPPPLTPAMLPSTPDKLLKVGTKGTPEAGWGKDGVATTRVHPQLVSSDGAGGAYVFDHQSMSANDTRVLVTHLAANGTEDAAFGKGGGLILGAPGITLMQGVTLDAKSRVVLLVSAKPMSSPQTSLIAYRFANGALDPSFGSGGAVTVSIPSSAVSQRTGPVAIGRDALGRVVIAGSDDPSAHRNVFIVRLLDNGSIDTAFAGTGVALGSQSNTAFDVSRVLVDGQSSRLWVVANKSVTGGIIPGAEPVPASGGIAVFRFDSNGAVDTKFGKGGSTLLEGYGALDAFATAGGPGADKPSQLVVGGYAGADATSLKPVLVRWNDNGALDTGFGSGGKLVLAGVKDATLGRIRRVARDGTGRIVVVGSYRTGSGPVTFVSRFDATGKQDTTFGSAGTTSFNVQAAEPEIDPQGNALFRGP